MKVKLEDVQVTKLNGTCLTLISQFSRALKAHNGVILQLTDPAVVQEVVKQAKVTSNPELRRICNMLIAEIRSHFSGEPSSRLHFPVYEKAEDSSVVAAPQTKNYQSKNYRRL